MTDSAVGGRDWELTRTTDVREIHPGDPRFDWNRWHEVQVIPGEVTYTAQINGKLATLEELQSHLAQSMEVLAFGMLNRLLAPRSEGDK